MNVLIVSGDSSPLRLLSLYTSGGGHRTTYCNSMQAALDHVARVRQSTMQRFDADRECIEILITDVNLADGSGIDLALQTKAMFAEVKSILVSGCAISQWNRNDTARYAALPSESVRLLFEPFTAAELLALIDELRTPPVRTPFWRNSLVRARHHYSPKSAA